MALDVNTTKSECRNMYRVEKNPIVPEEKTRNYLHKIHESRMQCYRLRIIFSLSIQNDDICCSFMFVAADWTSISQQTTHKHQALCREQFNDLLVSHRCLVTVSWPTLNEEEAAGLKTKFFRCSKSN